MTYMINVRYLDLEFSIISVRRSTYSVFKEYISNLLHFPNTPREKDR